MPTPIDLRPAKKKVRAERRAPSRWDQPPGTRLGNNQWRGRKIAQGFQPSLSHMTTDGYVPADMPHSGKFRPDVKLASAESLNIKYVPPRLVPERRGVHGFVSSEAWSNLWAEEGGWGMSPVLGRKDTLTAAQRLATFAPPKKVKRIRAATRRPI